MGVLTNTFTQVLISTGSQSGAALPPALVLPPPGEEKLASEMLKAGMFKDDLFGISVSEPANKAVHQITASLSGLDDGWFGPDSIAPSSTVIAEVAAALSQALILQQPELEVDIDGSVALVWELAEGETFALTFVGNGSVVGTTSPQSVSHPACAVPVGDSGEIAARLADRGIATRAS